MDRMKTLYLFRWLTDNNYRLLHAPDAANLNDEEVAKTIALAKDGQAFAAAHVYEVDISISIFISYTISIFISYINFRVISVKDLLLESSNSYLQMQRQLLEMDLEHGQMLHW